MESITPAEQAIGARASLEKNIAHDDVDRVNDEKYDSEESAEKKQEGVKRAEGITKVWSKKTMWIMFVL